MPFRPVFGAPTDMNGRGSGRRGNGDGRRANTARSSASAVSGLVSKSQTGVLSLPLLAFLSMSSSGFTDPPREVFPRLVELASRP